MQKVRAIVTFPAETPLLDTLPTPDALLRLMEAQSRQVAQELRAKTISAVSQTSGHPGAGLGVIELTVARPYIFNTAQGGVVKEGNRIALLTLGARLAECLKAAEILRTHGLSTTVADACFAKPLERRLILDLARRHEVLITIEDGSIGGFCSQVLHLLAEEGALDTGLKVRSMVLPDVFLDRDKAERLYAQTCLDAKGIVARALAALGRGDAARPGLSA